jgi:hypothetical protein
LIYFGQSPISQANCDRIQDGMTEEEVTQILGDSWVTFAGVFNRSLLWGDL